MVARSVYSEFSGIRMFSSSQKADWRKHDEESSCDKYLISLGMSLPVYRLDFPEKETRVDHIIEALVIPTITSPS